MFDDTTVITFHTPTHQEFQLGFKEKYQNLFKSYIPYNSTWVKNTHFYRENIDIFSYKKYFGYFLWKPLIISSALTIVDDGEKVLYCDSNVRFKDINGFKEIYDTMFNENPVFLIKHAPWKNSTWTKRDAFVLMDANESRYWNAHQIWTVVMGFKKCPETWDLINNYLYYCTDERILTEIPNEFGENKADFREHRWEQSIMSILAEKYQFRTVSDLTMMNYFEKIYTPELYRQKAEINKDVLAKDESI